MGTPEGWGPSHQTASRRRWKQRPGVQLVALVAVFALSSALGGFVIALIVVVVAMLAIQVAINLANAGPRAAAPATATSDDPLAAVWEFAAARGRRGVSRVDRQAGVAVCAA